MGYTNYWTNQRFSNDEWDEICEAAKKLFATTHIGITNVEVKFGKIRFDGPKDATCGTMLINRYDIGPRFCKTLGESYDIVVIALLFLITEIVPDFKWRSGGDLQLCMYGRGLAMQVSLSSHQPIYYVGEEV